LTPFLLIGWRGASKAFAAFHKLFPRHRTVVLDQTYRSTQNIVRTTNKLISNNTQRNQKNVWTANAEGDKVRLIISPDPASQTDHIASQINFLTREKHLRMRDIAVLCRTRKELYHFEHLVKKHSIPTSTPTLAFFKSKEILDILAYLDLVSGDLKDEAFLRYCL